MRRHKPMTGRTTGPRMLVRRSGLAAFVALAMVVSAAAVAEDMPDRREALQGGATTSIQPLDRNAFAHPAANLAAADAQRFAAGQTLFRQAFVPASGTNPDSDGLGPLFDARSCEACHLRDGRGRPFFDDASGIGLVLKTAQVPAMGPDPLFGRQLQRQAIDGLTGEGGFSIRWSERIVTLAGGDRVSLRKPEPVLAEDASGETADRRTLSLRLAQPVIGMGLLEAIADDDILARADPDDADGDGISGQVSQVTDDTGKKAVGRFGWKAETATIRQQSAKALSIDMGVSTSLFAEPWGDCTQNQGECRALSRVRRETGPDVSDDALSALVFYTRHVAVPARRKALDPVVLSGRALFDRIGCAACHVGAHQTKRQGVDPALAGQTIWPYTDLLLHDMGPDLADFGAPHARAREWRTPPLWGIGLTETVTGGGFYLHDGRARTVTEAILWHGGEAEKSRQAFAALPASDRAALLAFLGSL